MPGNHDHGDRNDGHGHSGRRYRRGHDRVYYSYPQYYYYPRYFTTYRNLGTLYYCDPNGYCREIQFRRRFIY